MAPYVSSHRPWATSLEAQGAFLINEDGDKLARYEYLPHGKPRALVYFAHGFADHTSRNGNLLKAFAEAGMLAFSHDHVGHGRSPGLRRHIDKFETYVRDAVADIRETRIKYPGLPLYVTGMSMGGLIAFLTAAELGDAIEGVVLLVPALAPDPRVATPCKIKMGHCFAGCCPKFGIGSIDMRLFSRNVEEVDKIKKDPLMCSGPGRAGWAVQTLKAMDAAKELAPGFSRPIFIVEAEGDQICHRDGNHMIMETIKSEDKTLRTYPGMYHDVLHELEDDTKRVIADIVEWVVAHLEGRNPRMSDLAEIQQTSASEPAEESVPEKKEEEKKEEEKKEEEKKEEEKKEEEKKEEEKKEEEKKEEEKKEEEKKEEENKEEEKKEEEAKPAAAAVPVSEGEETADSEATSVTVVEAEVSETRTTTVMTSV